MSYGANDLRSRLGGPAPGASEPNAAPYFADFTTGEPDEVSARGSRTWWVRGQNFALAHTVAAAGDVFPRSGQPDEYVALFATDPASATVQADGHDATVEGAAFVVVPPGDSSITTVRACSVTRLFSSASEDLLARCRNHDDYAEPHANVAPFAPWPAPPDGYRVRVYPVADHPYDEGRFGRLFRCSNFMVNIFDPIIGPRDPAGLSPHSHDDFEQCSLAVDGDYVHHIRSPWTTRLGDWREDEHVRVASPSVAVIPPPSVHTSRGVSEARNQLVDIFCPPREDFSAQPGWVINEAEYPLPAGSDGPR